MGTSPESTLIKKIHRQTDKYTQIIPANNEHEDIAVKLIFHMKMNMMPGGISGTPDIYYESNPGQLWVEYKHVAKWQGKRVMPTNRITPNQIEWLKRAVNNKQECAVIIGDNNGDCLILSNKQIFNPPKLSEMENLLKTPKETAKWIAQKVMKQNFKELK